MNGYTAAASEAGYREFSWITIDKGEVIPSTNGRPSLAWHGTEPDVGPVHLLSPDYIQSLCDLYGPWVVPFQTPAVIGEKMCQACLSRLPREPFSWPLEAIAKGATIEGDWRIEADWRYGMSLQALDASDCADCPDMAMQRKLRKDIDAFMAEGGYTDFKIVSVNFNEQTIEGFDIVHVRAFTWFAGGSDGA